MGLVDGICAAKLKVDSSAVLGTACMLGRNVEWGVTHACWRVPMHGCHAREPLSAAQH